MNKTDLVKVVAKRAGMTQQDAKVAMDATFDAIREVLASGDEVQIVGFGTFYVVEKQAREGVHPQSGERIIIPAKRTIKFKSGKELADAVK